MLDQIEQIRRRIEQRAYELFRQRDGGPGDPTADWLTAERETVWKPALELREKDGTFRVVAALPGVEAKDVSVDVSAEDMVVKAASTHSCSDAKGQVHQCEFSTAELFRSVHFPKPVDAAKAKAEYRSGLLTVTVPAARAVQAKPAVKAA
jgi:HSP20 family molecular chaperone IbpA